LTEVPDKLSGVRYKVQAPDDSTYREVVNLLSGRVHVFVASEKRRFLSTGDLPEDCLAEIAAKGAEVQPDIRYDMEIVPEPLKH
jgi:hypothetical protein